MENKANTQKGTTENVATGATGATGTSGATGTTGSTETKKPRVVRAISVEGLETCRQLIEKFPTETVMFNHVREVVELVITGENSFKIGSQNFIGCDNFFNASHVSEKPVLIEIIKGKGKHTTPYNLFEA